MGAISFHRFVAQDAVQVKREMFLMESKRLKYLCLYLVFAACVWALSGCKVSECKVLVACCEASQELEGIGSACGDLSADVRDPNSCRSIVKTIGYMHEDRDRPIPDVCIIE